MYASVAVVNSKSMILLCSALPSISHFSPGTHKYLVQFLYFLRILNISDRVKSFISKPTNARKFTSENIILVLI